MVRVLESVQYQDLVLPGDRDARGGGAHERNCRRDRGAELQSEATRSEATNHKTTPTTRTSCLLISQVGVSYALFVL